MSPALLLLGVSTRQNYDLFVDLRSKYADHNKFSRTESYPRNGPRALSHMLVP